MGAGGDAARGCDDFAAIAGSRAIPAAEVRDCICSFCFLRCWCRSSPARSSNGSSGAAGPLSVAKPIAFNFAHFAGTEAYASFPSAHAITSFALAFAVSAVWPRGADPDDRLCRLDRGSRLVLLAHHPSDVVAGALIGVVGAMCVRYWFAARRLGFAIARDGAIAPFTGPSLGRSSKGLPAGRQPHKKRTPRARRGITGCRPIQSDEC